MTTIPQAPYAHVHCIRYQMQGVPQHPLATHNVYDGYIGTVCIGYMRGIRERGTGILGHASYLPILHIPRKVDQTYEVQHDMGYTVPSTP